MHIFSLLTTNQRALANTNPGLLGITTIIGPGIGHAQVETLGIKKNAIFAPAKRLFSQLGRAAISIVFF